MKMHSSPSTKFPLLLRLTACCVFLFVPLLHAAPFTWDASGGGPLDDGPGNWDPTGGTNWFNGSTYGAWGNTTADTATFGVASGAAGTVTVSNVNANAIAFSAPGSGSYTLSGGTITLGGTTPTITANVAGTISSSLAGTAGLRKMGSGTLILSGNNSFSGTTTWSGTAGELVLGSDTALGTSTISIGGSGTLSSTGALGATRLINNTISMNGNAFTFGSATSNDRLVFTSTFAPAAGLPSMSASNVNVTFSGNLSGANQFRPGNGIIHLTGNNSSFTGGARLEAPGTLVVGNSNALGSSGLITMRGGTLQYGAGVTNDFSSRFDTSANTNAYTVHTGGNNVAWSTALTPGTATASFTKTGDGTLTLNSSSVNTFTGATTVRGGTLLLDLSNMTTPTNLVNSTSVLTLAGGTLAVKGKSTGTSSQTFGNTTVVDIGTPAPFYNGITVDSNGGTGTTLSLGSVGATPFQNRAVGSTLNVNLIGPSTLAMTTTQVKTHGWMTVTDSGSSGLGRTTGTGIVRLTGQTTLPASGLASGTDYITSGSFVMNAGSKQGNTLTLDATGGSGSLNIGTGTLTLTEGGLLLTGNSDYTISNGTVTSANTNQDTNVHTMGSGTLTISGTVSGQYLVKNGPGTLLLTSANSYGNGTRLVEGTLALGHSSAMGSGQLRVGNHGTLRADANLTLSNAISVEGRDYTSGGFNRTNFILNVDTNGNNVTAGGVISGNGGIRKSGSGTLTLSGANTYLGGTTIAGGALSISANNNLGDSKFTPLSVSGGTLQVTGTTLNNLNGRAVNWNSFNGGLDIANAANTFSVPNVISGAGSLTKSGAGTLILTAANTYTGTTTISAGTFALGSSASLASPTIRVQSGATFDASAVSGGFQLGNGQRLENKGTFVGPLTVKSGATFAPGNSPGTSTQNGSLTLNTGSNFEWELVGNTTSGAGTSFDQTVFTAGGLTIQTGVAANLVFNYAGSTVDWNNSFWDSNQTWTLFSGANALSTVAGVFTTLNVGNDSLAQPFSMAGGTFSFSSSGNDLLLNYTAVPEPSGFILLAAGVGLMLILRRRRSE